MTVAVRVPSRIVLPMTVGSRVERRRPETMRQDRHAGRVRPSSAASISRPSTGRKPHHSKYEPLTTPALHDARLAEADHREIDRREVAEGADRRDARLEVSISGTENVVFVGAEAGRALADVDQAILAAIDERPQQHAAHDAEDRGVGADAERQRDHDGGGQPLRAQQRAQADAHVLAERRGRVEPAAVPDAPHRFADGRDVAEFAQRSQARGFRILAALDSLLDAERQVAADLFVELVIVGSHRLTPFPPAPGS